jgi:hypothetical protein
MKLTHATKNNSRWAAANSTGAITLKIKQRLIGLSRTTFGSSGLSQEEILQHELPLSACKWAAANAAGYLLASRS